MSLLPRSEGVDLLAGLEQAAVVLLLDLGSNIVEGYKGRGSVDVIFKIRFTTARSAGDGIAS